MDREILLLVTGALISLVSSFLTSVFNYRLSKRQWLEQEQWEERKKLRNELAGTTHPLHKRIAEDIRHGVLGSRRGEPVDEQESTLLPVSISKLKVDRNEIIETLSKLNTRIEVGQLLQIALDSVDTSNN